MRKVRIPAIDWSEVQGARVSVPVKVNWPELQLTEHQIIANAIARANDEPDLFPDHSIFEVVIERFGEVSDAAE